MKMGARRHQAGQFAAGSGQFRRRSRSVWLAIPGHLVGNLQAPWYCRRAEVALARGWLHRRRAG